MICLFARSAVKRDGRTTETNIFYTDQSSNFSNYQCRLKGKKYNLQFSLSKNSIVVVFQRTHENDQTLPSAKKATSSQKTAPITDDKIVEVATITAAPTAKQLDPVERQRKAMAYKSFLNRGGPDAPGSKDIPQGMEGCLKSLTFVLTGLYSKKSFKTIFV